MKLSKKGSNPLFVEEEVYKWAEPKKNGRAPMLVLSLLFVLAGLLFGAMT